MGNDLQLPKNLGFRFETEEETLKRLIFPKVVESKYFKNQSNNETEDPITLPKTQTQNLNPIIVPKYYLEFNQELQNVPEIFNLFPKCTKKVCQKVQIASCIIPKRKIQTKVSLSPTIFSKILHKSEGNKSRSKFSSETINISPTDGQNTDKSKDSRFFMEYVSSSIRSDSNSSKAPISFPEACPYPEGTINEEKMDEANSSIYFIDSSPKTEHGKDADKSPKRSNISSSSRNSFPEAFTDQESIFDEGKMEEGSLSMYFEDTRTKIVHRKSTVGPSEWPIINSLSGHTFTEVSTDREGISDEEKIEESSSSQSFLDSSRKTEQTKGTEKAPQFSINSLSPNSKEDSENIVCSQYFQNSPLKMDIDESGTTDSPVCPTEDLKKQETEEIKCSQYFSQENTSENSGSTTKTSTGSLLSKLRKNISSSQVVYSCPGKSLSVPQKPVLRTEQESNFGNISSTSQSENSNGTGKDRLDFNLDNISISCSQYFDDKPVPRVEEKICDTDEIPKLISTSSLSQEKNPESLESFSEEASELFPEVHKNGNEISKPYFSPGSPFTPENTANTYQVQRSQYFSEETPDRKIETENGHQIIAPTKLIPETSSPFSSRKSPEATSAETPEKNDPSDDEKIICSQYFSQENKVPKEKNLYDVIDHTKLIPITSRPYSPQKSPETSPRGENKSNPNSKSPQITSHTTLNSAETSEKNNSSDEDEKIICSQYFSQEDDVPEESKTTSILSKLRERRIQTSPENLNGESINQSINQLISCTPFEDNPKQKNTVVLRMETFAEQKNLDPNQSPEEISEENSNSKAKGAEKLDPKAKVQKILDKDNNQGLIEEDRSLLMEVPEVSGSSRRRTETPLSGVKKKPLRKILKADFQNISDKDQEIIEEDRSSFLEAPEVSGSSRRRIGTPLSGKKETFLRKRSTKSSNSDVSKKKPEGIKKRLRKKTSKVEKESQKLLEREPSNGDTSEDPEELQFTKEFLPHRLHKFHNPIKTRRRVRLKPSVSPRIPPGGLKPLWTPPKSPHGLIEEDYVSNPWGLLVATIFLNKTSGRVAKPYIDDFLKNYPTPESVVSKKPEDFECYFEELGLKKRSEQIWKMSKDFLEKNWRHARELHGIGKYGDDAFRLFCIGDFEVEPEDRYLKIYHRWVTKDRSLDKGAMEVVSSVETP